MARISFEKLLAIYRDTRFDADGDEGLLRIATPEILTDLRLIDTDDDAARDANIGCEADVEGLTVGQEVRVRIGAPRLGLGRFSRSLSSLLSGLEARIEEPAAYFVIEGGLERDLDPVPAILAAYRKTLEIVALFSQAASYLDKTKQELVFIHEGKFVVPVIYDTATFEGLSIQNADRLLANFRDDVHLDQKLAILAQAICQICGPQPAVRRFEHLIVNLDAVADEVLKGYKLFASSFSFTKIRNEIEAARVDFVGKIHKTLIDIQGQLLGLPIATVIVASQFKVATSCGLEFWTNIGVLAGAWIFVALLLVAVINQWVTLNAIGDEIAGQKDRLQRDYAAISDQFTPIYRSLAMRICWHRAALVGVGMIAVVGALFASFVFFQITSVSLGACFAAVRV